MKKLFIALMMLTACQTTSTVPAESPQSEEVKAVIMRLFDGMRSGNGEMVAAVFTENATMKSIGISKEGVPVLRGDGSAEDFAKAVGAPHEKIWDERISSYEIRIDGNMATAWTPYQFYLGDTFSHCGVNAFHLFKSADGWKIFHIADTRRTTDCL